MTTTIYHVLCVFRVNFQVKKDDEWKDFEEEERKDYSGLKIGVMQINDDESNTGTDGEGADIGSDGELNADSSERRTGPWKKMAENAPAATEVVVEKPQATSNVYISPAMRAGQVIPIIFSLF